MNTANKFAPSSPWDQPSIDRLKELWMLMGNTAIAQKLTAEFKRYFSKSAVSSKAQRIGLPQKAGGNPKAETKRAGIRSVSSIALRATEKRARDAAAPIPATILTDATDAIPRVSLEHVQDIDGCRFPIGTPRTPNFGFCGAEREHADPHNPVSFWSGGQPYCAFHRHKTSVKTIRQIGEKSSRHDSGSPGLRVSGGGR
jgi:GcrA cell cycle regulator